MGMSINEALSHLDTYSSTMGSGQTTQEQHEDAKRVARDTMRKYQQLQADYENRLKADMVDMLEELDFRLSNYQDTDLIRQDIQQKINELKETNNG